MLAIWYHLQFLLFFNSIDRQCTVQALIYKGTCTVHWNCSRNLSKRFSIKYLAAVHIFCTFERDKYKCVFLITVSMGTLKILSCGYNLVTEKKLNSIKCYDTRSWEKGSFSSLSANKGVDQWVMRFTPFITPKNQAVKKKVIPKTNSLGSSSLLREVYRFEKGKISHSVQS